VSDAVQLPFADRVDAGRQLAGALQHLRGSDPVVVGLPRGGVPVALEVARSLGAPLDVIVVRKLGVPFQPELGMGAIGEDGIRVVNRDLVRQVGVSEEQLAEVEARERVELERRAQRFRAGRPRVPLRGRTVVVVDDGIATGSTARAACEVARVEGAARVVLAVPVAPQDWTARLADVADELVCLATPAYFAAVGQWYADFTATSDDEVVECLAAAQHPVWDAEVEIPVVGGLELVGHVALPTDARAIVVFAHGSGSSRHSPRNRAVAEALQRAGLGTLLFDLLTEQEERDRANVFDIELLAGRLDAVVRWVHDRPEARGLPIGCFGASTGAGAALWAAAEPGSPIAAVVSRGGRPDLAGERLGSVMAPTLLIVGGHDDVVLQLNSDAASQLRCEHALEVVPRATHLFEEPGALDVVAELAADWFLTHLP
jgi:putative phosphoribosyl transferase